jgi:hypothetical protein
MWLVRQIFYAVQTPDKGSSSRGTFILVGPLASNLPLGLDNRSCDGIPALRGRRVGRACRRPVPQCYVLQVHPNLFGHAAFELSLASAVVWTHTMPASVWIDTLYDHVAANLFLADSIGTQGPFLRERVLGPRSTAGEEECRHRHEEPCVSASHRLPSGCAPRRTYTSSTPRSPSTPPSSSPQYWCSSKKA